MVFLFAPIEVNPDLNEINDITTKIAYLGGNTGNIVWFEAVRKSIKHDFVGRRYSNNSRINNIVLPMANQINIWDQSLEWYLESIEGYHGRVTVIGLGVQLTDELNTPKKLVNALPQERKNALKELSYRTESFGIRGSITAESLDLMGIKNYTIIGCPSFYMKHSIEEGYNKKATSEKLCVNWGSNDYVKEQFVREFFRCNAEEGDCLILQAMDDFPKTLNEGEHLLEKHIKSRYPDLAVNSLEIESYIKKRGRIFFSWDIWQNFLKEERFTLSVGCRFHGNMMSLLAGIPALWIVHDSRTYELCEAMALPYIDLGQAAKMKSREEFAECCVYDEKFYRNRNQMQAVYEMFLKKNGIERV